MLKIQGGAIAPCCSPLRTPMPIVVVKRSRLLASDTTGAPPLWDKLPPGLRQISDRSYEHTKTSPLAITHSSFTAKLKRCSSIIPILIHSFSLPPFPSQLLTQSNIAVWLQGCLPYSLDLTR